MNHLELFSGTHSFGKVTTEMGYNVVSLDRDLGNTNGEYTSKKHFKEDILTWDYKQYPKKHFKLITASPVCLWWSNLRSTWIGRKLKAHNGEVCTRELLNKDIDLFGKPMVDKVREIIDYFEPEFYLIENPESGKMKTYITDLPYHDFDYCKFGFDYRKRTRFWTNIPNLESIKCKKDCDSMVTIELPNKTQKIHKTRMGVSRIVDPKTGEISLTMHTKHKAQVSSYGGGTNRTMRYRIPTDLVKHVIEKTL